jgi:hypothetical protein
MNCNLRRLAVFALFAVTLSSFVPMRAADNQSLNKKQLKSAIANARRQQNTAQ